MWSRCNLRSPGQCPSWASPPGMLGCMGVVHHVDHAGAAVAAARSWYTAVAITLLHNLLVMQGAVLHGHQLVLQLSMRKQRAPGGQQQQQAGMGGSKQEAAAKELAAKGKGTKLVVRNVAFEATRKDVAALFAPFGQIKSCRLPKKFDGNHRRAVLPDVCAHVCAFVLVFQAGPCGKQRCALLPDVCSHVSPVGVELAPAVTVRFSGVACSASSWQVCRHVILMRRIEALGLAAAGGLHSWTS